ncbi:MAG TPA: hypothetical protein VGM25_03765 [Caulobacteraceae bacterium]|jgi:hypothetical protein
MSNCSRALAATSVALFLALPMAAHPQVVGAPPVEYIRQLFAQASGQFVEVGGPSSQYRPQRAMGGAAVATKAKQAGEPGLCVATVAEFRFAGTNLAGADPLTAHRAFKIVGSLAPLPDLWSKQYEAELAGKCAQAGRVLSTGAAPFDQEMFFVDATPHEVGAWFSARALEVALQQARDGALDLHCGSPSTKDDGCREALSDKGTLRLQRLLKVEAKPCAGSVSSCYHVTGEFLDTASQISGGNWIMDLDAMVTVPRRNERDVGAVTNVRLTKTAWIF